MTLDNAGISKEYAERYYNMTEDDLNRALNESKAALADDPLLREINSSATLVMESMIAEKESIESINFLEIWLDEMSNISSAYFNVSECDGYKDCVLYAISELYTSFEYEDIPNVDNIRKAILDLEYTLIDLFQIQSLIEEIAIAMDGIMSNITFINEANPFCSEAPIFLTELKNQTVLNGTDVLFICNVTGFPFPNIKWFMEDNLLPNETAMQLVINDVSANDSGVYRCEVGNIVANLTSTDTYLQVFTYDDDECQMENGGCEHTCENLVGSYICNCFDGYRLNGDRRNCDDLDECLIGTSNCEQTCSNNQGSFTCGCKDGFEIDSDGHSCKLSSGLDDRILVVIVSCCVLLVATLAAMGTFLYFKPRSPKIGPEIQKGDITYIKPFTVEPAVEYGPSKPVFDIQPIGNGKK
ncbi:titin-like [Ruditapes philippinarum]|uniref:titin-like n=1 Tax=Ruditapes philippinarum TaxID=129788 RepID=UPI00295B6A52|nr:titin-like [Ruditapes philippinarum]